MLISATRSDSALISLICAWRRVWASRSIRRPKTPRARSAGIAWSLKLPLQHFWPGTFSDDRLEERARDLWDNAHGAGLALLVVVVVVGAPLVEELVYRGLLQGALTRRLDDVVGLVAAALWFAAIHFQPVEFPGLFMIGLVLGVCMWRTGRLGMPILAHVAFNATGLALAAGR